MRAHTRGLPIAELPKWISEILAPVFRWNSWRFTFQVDVECVRVHVSCVHKRNIENAPVLITPYASSPCEKTHRFHRAICGAFLHDIQKKLAAILVYRYMNVKTVQRAHCYPADCQGKIVLFGISMFHGRC